MQIHTIPALLRNAFIGSCHKNFPTFSLSSLTAPTLAHYSLPSLPFNPCSIHVIQKSLCSPPACQVNVSCFQIFPFRCSGLFQPQFFYCPFHLPERLQLITALCYLVSRTSSLFSLGLGTPDAALTLPCSGGLNPSALLSAMHQLGKKEKKNNKNGKKIKEKKKNKTKHFCTIQKPEFLLPQKEQR